MTQSSASCNAGWALALMTKIGGWQTVGEPALSSTLSIVDASQ